MKTSRFISYCAGACVTACCAAAYAKTPPSTTQQQQPPQAAKLQFGLLAKVDDATNPTIFSKFTKDRYTLCYSYSTLPSEPTLYSTTLAGLSCGVKPSFDFSADAVKAGLRLSIVITNVPLYDNDLSNKTCSALKSVDATIVTASIAPPPDVEPPAGATTPPAGAASPDIRAAGAPPPPTLVGHGICYADYAGGLLAGDTLVTVTMNKVTTDPDPSKTTTTEIAAPWTLPPVHNYYRYAVSTGVIVSSVLNKSFGYAASGKPYNYITTNSDPLVEPVVFLTYYPGFLGNPNGADPEKPPYWGVVAGLSEKNPTTNFYLGASYEPIKYIAIVFGANAAQISRVSNGYDPGAVSGHLTPFTTNVYRFGGFVGVNVNISNFFQSLFK